MTKNSFREISWTREGMRRAESAFFPFRVIIDADASTCIIDTIHLILMEGEKMPEYDIEILHMLLPMKLAGNYLEWVDKSTLIPKTKQK